MMNNTLAWMLKVSNKHAQNDTFLKMNISADWHYTVYASAALNEIILESAEWG